MTDAPGDAAVAERVRVLALALGDEQVSVAWNAARDLARVGEAAAPALPALSAAVRGPDATTAVWARYAIAKITGDAAKHLPFLVDALSDRRVFPGMAAAAIAGFGQDAAALGAVPALTKALADPHADNRWSAAGALANIGAGAQDAVPALTAAIRDADERVRWYAAWALGEIGPEARAAIPVLGSALDDPDDDVRGYAARALGRIGGAQAAVFAPKLASMAADDTENERVRGEAMAAIKVLTGE